MRNLLIATVVLSVATPAFAHTGHVAAVAGHDHYGAIAAAVLAVAVIAGGLILRTRATKR